MKRNDLTGQTIGHLKVVEMLYGYGKHDEGYCRCLCECVTECIKSAYNLTLYRNPPHCGCKTEFYKRIQSNNSRVDLTGRRFGSLVVTEMIYKDNEPTFVKCVCDCGNVITKRATYITCGDTTSCGCVQKQRAGEANQKDFTGVKSDYGIEFLCKDRMNNKHQWLWKCKCPCGKTFTALPAKILNGHITSCGCQKQSGRERLIDKILKDNNVAYVREYIFPDCKDKCPLRFDFFLKDHNIVIEYQGEQHYRAVSMFGGDSGLELRKRHDEMKREYCKQHNINLVELPYLLSDKEINKAIVNIIYP